MGQMAGGIISTAKGKVAGGFNTAAATSQSRADRRSLEGTSRQLRLNADALEAAGIRESKNTLNEGDTFMDEVRTSVVAGGLDLSSPGSITRLAKLEDKIQYNALASIYESRVDASKERYQAALNDIQAQQMKRNSQLQRYAGVLQ